MKRSIAVALLALTACAGSSSGSSTPPLGAFNPARVAFAPMTATVGPASAMINATAPDVAAMERRARSAAALRRTQGTLNVNWTGVPASAVNVAVSPSDGSVWALSTAPSGPNKYIYHLVNGAWIGIPGALSQLAVAPDGSLWGLTSVGGVYHYANGAWTGFAGAAHSIATDGAGNLYVVAGLNGGDNSIWRATAPTFTNWTQLAGAGAQVAANPDASLYVVTSSGTVWNSPSFGANGYTSCPGYLNDIVPLGSGNGFIGLGWTPSPGAGSAIYAFTPTTAGNCSSGSYQVINGWGQAMAGYNGSLAVVGTDNNVYTGNVAVTAAPSSLPALPLALNVNNLPGEFYGEILAQFSGVSPRQMVVLPNGDLLIGTGGGTANFAQSGQIYIIPNPEAAAPPRPSVFATLADGGCASSAGTNTNGIAFAAGSGGGTIFVGMECSVWKIPYVTGDKTASSAPSKFLTIRTGSPPAGSDGDVHHTTSLVVAGSTLYVSIGSSCNACTETDPTRATVQKSDVTTPSLTPVATRLRNALALALNPATGTVWAGGAGQDCVVGATCFAAMDATYALNGHPYEWIDLMTKRGAPVDYLWPWCEENKMTVTNSSPGAGSPPPGVSCANMVVAPVRAPAYSTIIGATFYAPPANAAYAFPSSFRNGLFLALHGSWHEDLSGVPVAVPQVVFVPIDANDAPVYPMDWTNGGSPFATWARNASGNPAPFMNGFQSLGTRIGRPVGLAIGTSGSLFVADDAAGMIYRIRPGSGPH